MSPVVVFIGWVLLIPSLLGVVGSAIGGVTSIAAGATGATAAAEMEETREERIVAEFGPRFDAVGLDRGVLSSLLSDASDFTTREIQELPREQAQVAAEAQVAILGDEIGTAGGAAASAAVGGLGVVFFGVLGVMSVVAGLLGWLLVMKKKVLQCTNCGATVAAG